jgi:hypothetical protein
MLITGLKNRKEMIQLNYFDKDFNQVPLVLEFRVERDLSDWLAEHGEEKKLFKTSENVWIVTNGCERHEVFVTDRWDVICTLLFDGYLSSTKSKTVHIQQYDTWEGAYAVALDMREGKKNCYN